MSITEKMARAKKTNWPIEGMSEAEVKTTVELAKISAKIESCRNELGMTQAEFADYMGVSQGMVSKWESREYNFTVRSLNEIFQKLDLNLSIEIRNTDETEDCSTLARKKKETIGNNNCVSIHDNKEAVM